ncbi:MAG: class I SAM-dependent methyltransferase [Candidatus Contendobacter sp.]|nr:class I SAM-dependent methyltransferase [Candidatus Contendobacter sp.]MDG4559652.1 class I SAM-dependent methyltransferase [Candidatus Contendobacter sp.]
MDQCEPTFISRGKNMLLDPQKDADLLSRIEAALNEPYLIAHLGKLERESAEGRLAVENAVFRRYNQAAEYAVPWVNRAAPLAGSRMVEIGCGPGSSTAAFARLAEWMDGYDIEPASVEGARIRARLLGLTNVACHAVAPDRLLSEIRRRHGKGQVDLVLLYAVLEHCTPAECLETIRTSWDLLRPGGHLVVIETPNRFGYMDVHTTFLPFFHLLPDHIALRYYHRTQRRRVLTTLDDAARRSEREAELARIRLGTGISFHEFQIALGIDDLGAVLVADGYEPEMLAWFPITLEERLLQTFFLARDVPAPIGFARFVLNVILRKPTGALPTEPLIPLASRTEFLVNYADVKVDSPMQRARSLQEFERLEKVEWVISGSDADSLAPANQVSIAHGVDHLRLQASGHDPYLYLPPLDAPLPRAIMKIDIDAPSHSILQVFHTTREQHDYAEERSIRMPIYRGRNLLLVELPAGVTGRLRLDPGEMPGEYRVYRIELRR